MAIDARSLWFSAVSKRRHFQGMGASHFPDKRNRHRLGAHAVSGDAAGGVGGAQWARVRPLAQPSPIVSALGLCRMRRRHPQRSPRPRLIKLLGELPGGEPSRRLPASQHCGVAVSASEPEGRQQRADLEVEVARGTRRADPRGPVAGHPGSCDQPSSARLPPALLTEVPMRRIGLAVVLALSVVLTSLAAEAQQGVRVEGQRVPRIGVACNNCVSHPKPDDPLAAFLQELSRLGYKIGKNVVVDIRGTTGDRFPDIIAELVRAPVDVLVVSPTAAALAAKAANLSIPVVFTVVAEPVELGLCRLSRGRAAT